MEGDGWPSVSLRSAERTRRVGGSVSLLFGVCLSEASVCDNYGGPSGASRPHITEEVEDGLLLRRLESLILFETVCCCVDANFCTRHRCSPTRAPPPSPQASWTDFQALEPTLLS